MQDLTHLSSLSQVLVSNSLAGLSGSTAERIYCDNLNISVCPLTESSKKVTHPYKIKCVTLNIYILMHVQTDARHSFLEYTKAGL